MIYKLQGVIQNYAWGGKNFIPTFLNLSKDIDTQYAEYWLGSHASAPSQILINDQWINLDQYLKRDNVNILSNKSINKYGFKLPYLLKILDVASPLSIQIHPTKKQAELGFANENKLNIPLDAKNRTYKDDNHKPEMMIALSKFWLLHGFKAKAKILNSLQEKPSLQELYLFLLQNTDMHKFYAYVMQASQTQLQAWLRPIITDNMFAFKQNKLLKNNPDYWILHTIEKMNIDLNNLESGLLCFYIFNIVKIQIGEGIYQDAGIPHAYLEGQNIELMSASDNVIRGGLTPKYIDINALLNTIDTSEITPNIIDKALNTNHIYPTPCDDFQLEYVSFSSKEKHKKLAQEASIMLVIDGTVKITTNNNSITLNKGESILLSYNTDYMIEGISSGYCVIATNS